MTHATALPNPFHFAPIAGRHEIDRIVNPPIAAVPPDHTDRFASNMAKIERIESPLPDRFEAIIADMMRELADIVAGIDARHAVDILERLAS